MTFGSLFSGIGGLDLGLERAGMRCVFQVEINEFCRRVLARHWPDVPRHDDARTFRPTKEHTCDLIAGGFPCKQTSRAASIHGRRTGLAGPDSGLWVHQWRIIRTIRPRWVIIENPAGVDTWAGAITGDLEAIGYSVSRVPLSAERVGAPHLRRRVFFVANSHGPRLQVPRQAGPSQDGGVEGRTADGNPWMQALPGVLRVDDGLPPGVDRRQRIIALGNAVVPAMAEHIGRLVMAQAS